MHIVRHPFFRWVACIILLALMAYQLWDRSDHFQNFRVESWRQAGWFIALAALLMPVNWWLETLKWHSFLSVHAKISFQRAFKAVTGGIALSIFTPNRIGEYGGRILFLPYGIRWPVVFSTLMGSISQNLVTFTCGIFSFIFLFKDMVFFQVTGLLFLILATISFFKINKVVEWICRWKLPFSLNKISTHLGYLKDYHTGLMLRSLGLSLARYLVYTFQFVILLIGFEPGASPFHLFLGISCLYLFHTVVPMPPVADVLARTNIALILWSGTGMSELSISLASFIVWIINLLIPAILGSLAIGTINTKKPFNSHDPHLSPSYQPVVSDLSKVN